MILSKDKIFPDCMSCGATAQFHLQNPFGVRSITNRPGEYYSWNNTPSNVGEVFMCPNYVTSGIVYDHDDLFRYVSGNM